jgi:shikimate dehydrogenase
VVYAAAAADAAGAPGQLTVDELVRDYGLPELPAVERIYGIAGNPVLSTSLSPRLHNGAYRELGVAAVYLAFEAESLGDFWLDVVESDLFPRLGLPLAGLSVTAPFKRAALAVAGAVSPLVECVGAANTLVARQGVWEAECTDAAGVTGSLAARGVELTDRRAVVVGAGGAGRAAAFGLARAGAHVVLANRGAERGRSAAETLDLTFLPLDELRPEDFDVLVNATPLGKSDDDPLPFAVDALRPGAAVLDLVYRDRPTRLLSAVAAAGRVAVDGREMLIHQALDQFRLMTGRELSTELAHRLLELPQPPSPEVAP